MTCRLRGSKHQSRSTLGLLHEHPGSACIPSRRIHRNNMERPLHLLHVERIPISLSALPSTATVTFRPSASSLNRSDAPPLSISLQYEVPPFNPQFSLRGENWPPEVRSNNCILIPSDPLQFLVKLQSEESAPARACSPFPSSCHFVDNL